MLARLDAISSDLSGVYDEELAMASDTIRKDIIGIYTECLENVREQKFDMFANPADFMFEPLPHAYREQH